MKIDIDGKILEGKEGQSLLKVALDGGVYIPHLCDHPDLEAKGGCRLCSVEIEGHEEAVPACKTLVEDGMVVTVNGAKAQKVRKMAMELILASHPADCTGCPKYGKCELQSMYQYLGISPEGWRKKSRTVANDDSNPMISHLFTRCVRCGRCVRACQELRGVKVLDYIKTDVGIHAGVPDGKTLEEAGCRFCGACIEVCPTGAIMDQVHLMDDKTPYSDNVLPCKASCPAHIDIPRYLRSIKEGNYDEAIAVIREKVPFPESLGSVCTHFCEQGCKRNEVGNPISVCRLKKFAAQQDTGVWKAKSRHEDQTGKKVAVIGAGPAGMTSAYYLAKKGHEVTVFEANEHAGGQCRYGIPAYRLPNEVVGREVDTILEEGVTLKTNKTIENPKQLLEDGFDGVLVATGTHKGVKLPLKGNDLPQVHINTEFLKSVRIDQPLPIGERVMVLGGGNVAYDCARTALRLGAKEAHIACLEDLDQMTATPDEIEEGREEGVILHAKHSFLEIQGSDKVEGVKLQKVEQFYFDENRKAVIELVEGSETVVSVDCVIFAVGQKPLGTESMGLELVGGSYIKTEQDSQTSVKGIFAAGDVVTGTKSMIDAIAAGRKAAEEMDKYLGGDGDINEVLASEEKPNGYIGQAEGMLRKSRIEHLATCEDAQAEASRCLQCDLRLQLEKVKLWNEY